MAELTAAEIKALLHEVLEEQRKNFWVEPEQHFLDHDMLKVCRGDRERWRRNHEFVEGVIDSASTAKKIGIGGLLAAIGGFGLWIIKVAWTAVLSGAK
jgi:hypothetical protein